MKSASCEIAPLSPVLVLPALVALADERAQRRFLEFFAVTIRNPHTRRAYARACGEFLGWCEARGVRSILAVMPLHVAGYIEELTRERSAPTAKQRLAAIRHLFDWLVIGQVVPVNPAASVRGPAHSVRRGKTPVLAPEEARQLLDSIDGDYGDTLLNPQILAYIPHGPLTPNRPPRHSAPCHSTRQWSAKDVF